MERLGRLRRKDFYRLMLCAGFIISLASVEILAKAKDLDYFNFIRQSLEEQGRGTLNYEDFVVGMLGSYLGKIIIPAGLAFNTWYAFMRSGYNRTFIWVWSIFTGAALGFQILSLELNSIFYYLFILLYLILLIFLIRLPHHREQGGAS